MRIERSNAFLIQALKSNTRAVPPGLSLAVGRPVESILRPVATAKDWLSYEDIRLLTRWRNRHVQAFLTEFLATEKRTAHWLTDTIGPDDTRILFMVVEAKSGRTIGYMGLAFIDWSASYGEADAIVRGAKAVPGLMSRAMRHLLNWAHQQLQLQHLGVRVRSDNSALRFYRKFGFQETRRVALRRISKPDMVQWVEDATLPKDTIPSLVHMELINHTQELL